MDFRDNDNMVCRGKISRRWVENRAGWHVRRSGLDTLMGGGKKLRKMCSGVMWTIMQKLLTDQVLMSII